MTMRSRTVKPGEKWNNAKAWTPDIVRQRIQASQIVNRLTKHVMGEVDMKASAVTAALGLLRKVVPDLANVEVSGEMNHRYVMGLPQAVDTAAEWTRQHAPTALQ